MTVKNSIEKSAILGIDIGGTGIKAELVDPVQGKLISNHQKRATPTPATADSTLSVVHQLIEHFKWSGSLGCGFPGVIKNGVVYTAANLHPSWLEMNLAVKLCYYVKVMYRLLMMQMLPVLQK